MLPAYAWLTWQRRRASTEAELRLIAETETRVIEHMRLVPDLRWLGRVQFGAWHRVRLLGRLLLDRARRPPRRSRQ